MSTVYNITQFMSVNTKRWSQEWQFSIYLVEELLNDWKENQNGYRNKNLFSYFQFLVQFIVQCIDL